MWTAILSALLALVPQVVIGWFSARRQEAQQRRDIIEADRAKGHALDADLQRKNAEIALNRPDAGAVDRKLRDGNF